jgi:hypothetical protein
MGALLSFFSTMFGGIFGAIAKSTIFAWIAPIISGVASVIGGLLTAVVEIIVALAGSPEGRVVLGICAVGLAFLYLRFHYIEEGKAMVKPQMIREECQAVACTPSYIHVKDKCKPSVSRRAK